MSSAMVPCTSGRCASSQHIVGGFEYQRCLELSKEKDRGSHSGDPTSPSFEVGVKSPSSRLDPELVSSLIDGISESSPASEVNRVGRKIVEKGSPYQVSEYAIKYQDRLTADTLSEMESRVISSGPEEAVEHSLVSYCKAIPNSDSKALMNAALQHPGVKDSWVLRIIQIDGMRPESERRIDEGTHIEVCKRIVDAGDPWGLIDLVVSPEHQYPGFRDDLPKIQDRLCSHPQTHAHQLARFAENYDGADHVRLFKAMDRNMFFFQALWCVEDFVRAHYDKPLDYAYVAEVVRRAEPKDYGDSPEYFPVFKSEAERIADALSKMSYPMSEAEVLALTLDSEARIKRRRNKSREFLGEEVAEVKDVHSSRFVNDVYEKASKDQRVPEKSRLMKVILFPLTVITLIVKAALLTIWEIGKYMLMFITFSWLFD